MQGTPEATVGIAPTASLFQPKLIPSVREALCFRRYSLRTVSRTLEEKTFPNCPRNLDFLGKPAHFLGKPDDIFGNSGFGLDS